MILSLVVSFLPRLGDDDDSLSPDHVGFVRDALREPLPAGQDTLAIVLPAPFEAPEKFLRLVPRDMGFLWRSPHHVQLAGGGCARKIHASGHDRFASLRDQAKTFWARLALRCPPGMKPLAPVLFGGAAFGPHVPPVEPWEEFTEDAFTLPRFGYRRGADAAYVTLSVTREELSTAGAAERIERELATLMNALAHESATSMIERVVVGKGSIFNLPANDWAAYIDTIHAAIRTGDFDKIVAARRCVINLSRALEDAGFMARLFAAYPTCTHFALRRDRKSVV